MSQEELTRLRDTIAAQERENKRLRGENRLLWALLTVDLKNEEKARAGEPFSN
jgi:hypothetical protein